MNKQLKKDIALVKKAFINGDNDYKIRSIEKFLSGRINDIKYIYIDRYSTVVITALYTEEFYYFKAYTTNLIPAIVHVVSLFYKNLDMMMAPSKANKVFFLDKDIELKFYKSGLGDIETLFVVGFEYNSADTMTYVFDDKDKKYTKKFWKRLGAHRVELIKYFKRIEKFKKLNKYTIDSHVVYHLKKYYNSLSPSEKLEVELGL